MPDIEQSWFPLQRAVLCLDCSAVSNAVRACPACACTSLLNLAVILNRTSAPLDPEAANVLHANLWDLYETTP